MNLMKAARTGLAAMALMAAAAPAWAEVQPLTGDGIWRNKKNSVHVQLRPCAGEICGYVVWASPKAIEDAREGGSPNLVGMQLLRGFKVGADGVGRGKVFVPDLKLTFGGAAERLNNSTLRVRGCLVGGVFCKTQIWTRIDSANS